LLAAVLTLNNKLKSEAIPQPYENQGLEAEWSCRMTGTEVIQI
jgi:hypothetical protein